MDGGGGDGPTFRSPYFSRPKGRAGGGFRKSIPSSFSPHFMAAAAADASPPSRTAGRTGAGDGGGGGDGDLVGDGTRSVGSPLGPPATWDFGSASTIRSRSRSRSRHRVPTVRDGASAREGLADEARDVGNPFTLGGGRGDRGGRTPGRPRRMSGPTAGVDGSAPWPPAAATGSAGRISLVGSPREAGVFWRPRTPTKIGPRVEAAIGERSSYPDASSQLSTTTVSTVSTVGTVGTVDATGSGGFKRRGPSRVTSGSRPAGEESFLNRTVNATGDHHPGCFVAIIEGRGSARGEVGLASVSPINPTLIVCQFSDSRTYTRTLTKLAVLNPSEIVLPNFGAFGWSGVVSGGAYGEDGSGPPGTLPDSSSSSSSSSSKFLRDVVDQCPSAKIAHINRKYFKDARGMQAIRHLCAPEYATVEFQLRHKNYGLASAFALLKYIEYMHNILYAPKSLKVEFQASENTALIDAETAKNVDLLVNSSDPFKGGNRGSLFGVLNKCSTPGGIRSLRSTLFQPPVQPAVIDARLSAVEELVELRPEILDGLRTVLSRFCDVDRLLSLCVVLPREETLAAVESRINNVIGLKHALELVAPLRATLMAAESSLMVESEAVLRDPRFPEILEEIRKVIHDEARVKKGSAAMRLQRCFAIKAGVNGLLDMARRAYCEIVDEVEAAVKALAQEHGLPIKVGYNAFRGYHAQISVFRAKSKVNVKDLPQSFLNPQKCRRNLICFTTDSIIKADARSQDVLRDINLMSNAILVELLATVRKSIGCLYRLSEVVSTLDVVSALAETSSHAHHVRPRFVPDRMIVRQSRHPILEAARGGESRGAFAAAAHGSSTTSSRCSEVVANDIECSENGGRFRILTGPNMAGKSTYLRQVVLLQVMAQVGCYVPAEAEEAPPSSSEGSRGQAFREKRRLPEFRICDSIFSRINTADSPENNASTFTLEMSEVAFILTNLGRQALVIMDELGRGTSAEEGSALCWAISESLIRNHRGAFVFLSTHFSLMPRLERLYPNRVVNHHFVTEIKPVQDKRLTHTHKLVKGQPDSATDNYGIDCASLSALPSTIIDKARQISGQLHQGAAAVPDLSEKDVMSLNYLHLVNKLKMLRAKVVSMVEDESGAGGSLSLDAFKVSPSILEEFRSLQTLFKDSGEDEE